MKSLIGKAQFTALI